MSISEVTVKMIDRLGQAYGDLIDQQEVRQMIEEVLYDYDITPKETLPATLDDMNEKAYMYLASKKIDGLSENSLKSYGQHLKRFTEHIRKNVADITTMDIRIYLAEYAKTGVKKSTIATETDIIRGFFNWLETEEYINKSPMKKIKTIKQDKNMRKALTKKELEILRGGAKTLRQKALLEFFYSTGCRLEEVEHVKKDDIDWQQLILKVKGKGNKERIVYINATTQVHLRKYLMSRLDECEALFVTSRKPYKPMSRRTIQREIDKIADQSDLNKNIYPHLLRHTAATHWLNAGMEITTVQAILGHDNLDTTQIYAQTSRVTVENEYRKYS